MRSAVAAAMLLGLAATGAMAAPKIEVAVVPTEITVGDRIEMTVTIHADSPGGTDSVRFPTWDETLGPAEILAIGPVEEVASGEQTIFRQRLVLTLFQLGEVTLPPVEAILNGTQGEIALTSVSSRVTVHSVLPETAEEIEAKPPAPPRRPGLGNTFWWSAAALLATCLVAIVALRKQASDLDVDEPHRPRLAPIEELRRSLAALGNETAVEPIHAEISLAVRRFLGRVLRFPAPESTTTEVRSELRQRNLSTDLVRQTSDLLTACDMVMFARRDVEIEAARTRIGDAKSIADGVLETFTPDSGSPQAEEPS